MGKVQVEGKFKNQTLKERYLSKHKGTWQPFLRAGPKQDWGRAFPELLEKGVLGKCGRAITTD